MIDQDELAAARERLGANPDKARAAADVDLFDRVLVAAQGYDEPARTMVEHGLTFLGLDPSPDFCARMLPHDGAFDQKDIGMERSLCAVLRERLLEAAGVDWDELYRPLARRPPKDAVRLQPLTAELAFAGKHDAKIDTTKWVPGSYALQPADGLFVGNPGGAPGVWSKRDYDSAHARTVALVEGDEVITIDGGGPGNHFAHLRVVEDGGQLWTMARADPGKGRRVFAITRCAAMPVRA